LEVGKQTQRLGQVPLMALSRLQSRRWTCPLLGLKQTSLMRALLSAS